MKTPQNNYVWDRGRKEVCVVFLSFVLILMMFLSVFLNIWLVFISEKDVIDSLLSYSSLHIDSSGKTAFVGCIMVSNMISPKNLVYSISGGETVILEPLSQLKVEEEQFECEITCLCCDTSSEKSCGDVLDCSTGEECINGFCLDLHRRSALCYVDVARALIVSALSLFAAKIVAQDAAQKVGSCEHSCRGIEIRRIRVDKCSEIVGMKKKERSWWMDSSDFSEIDELRDRFFTKCKGFCKTSPVLESLYEHNPNLDKNDPIELDDGGLCSHAVIEGMLIRSKGLEEEGSASTGSLRMTSEEYFSKYFFFLSNLGIFAYFIRYFYAYYLNPYCQKLRSSSYSLHWQENLVVPCSPDRTTVVCEKPPTTD